MLIPLDQIDRPGVDLRTQVDEGAVIEMAESIRRMGLLSPVGVARVGERYRLVYGQTRFLAHRWLGLLEVECKLLSAEQVSELEQGAAENLVRRAMNPVEEGRAVRQLVDVEGRAVRDVARGIGKSESWVRSRLELLTFPVEIVELLARGELVPAVARELVLVEDERVRAVYLRCAVENGVTASQARQWRLDWEAGRAYGAGDDNNPLAPSVSDAPRVPHVLCHGCGLDFPVVELVILRVCGICSQEAIRANRVARGAVVERGGPSE